MPLDTSYSRSTLVPDLGPKLADSFASVASAYIVLPIQMGVVGVLSVLSNVGLVYPVTFDAQATPNLVHVIAAVKTPPVGGNLVVDVNKNGTTIFSIQSNRPTIVAGAAVSSVSIPDVTSLVAGDVLTIDVDQIGPTSPGADLSVVILLKQRLLFL